MKRLCCRYLLVALSLSTLVASITFLLGQSKTAFATIRTPAIGCTVRADAEGWIFQIASPGSIFDYDFSTQPGRMAGTWASQLEDLSPTWITGAVVYSGWQVNSIRFNLIGIRHYAMISILAISTLLYALWLRRRWPTSLNSDVP